jgi:uncharacterized protein (DUF1778 family)
MPKPMLRQKPTPKVPRAKRASATKATPSIQRAVTAGAINIRVRPDERALIDQAAALAGKSRSEFMLEAAREAATATILDRTLFRMGAGAFSKFVAMLDAPPQPNARLRKLMQTKAPWA